MRQIKKIRHACTVLIACTKKIGRLSIEPSRFADPGLFIFLTLVLLPACSFFKRPEVSLPFPPQVASLDDVAKIFPRTAGEVAARCECTQKYVDATLKNMLAIPDNLRNRSNTLYAFDRATAALRQETGILEDIAEVSPDKNLRDAAYRAIVVLQDKGVDLASNKPVYHALKAYAHNKNKPEVLTPEEEYFLQETLSRFKRNGLDLPEGKQEEVRALKKEIARLERDFEKNISDDVKKICVLEEELAGLTPAFINAFELCAKGGIKMRALDITVSVVTQVLENCACEKTRKRVRHAFVNRAYPANKKILLEMIRLRDRLAHLLGYSSYAAYDIDHEMAENPETVDRFLHDMYVRSEKKVHEEVARYLKDMPTGVALTSQGKVNPWDWAFIKTAYRKKNYDLDERVVAEYFPLNQTIERLIPIFEKFFDAKIRYVHTKNLWHKDVSALEVHVGGQLRGYILLDLFPRPHKYTHACCCELVPYLLGGNSAGVTLIIANFPRPLGDRPALLHHENLTTLLHELGHAFHGLVRSTTLAGSELGIRTDFVEIPSQLLEECAWQPEILAAISGHYKTQEPLPDAVIKKITALKYFDLGDWSRRLLTGSYMSLDYFKSGEVKDVEKMAVDITARLKPYLALMPDDYSYASFGHLTAYYASKYYSYLWSKVYARELFDYMKKRGLVGQLLAKSPGTDVSEMGARYVSRVLAPCGSRPPLELLRDFLGRQPTSEAFFKDFA